MTDDKILFLSFPFISPEFPVQFVKEKYQELAKELKIEKHWEFEDILNWFEDDKISVAWGTIMFAHPSYSEAVEHLLIKKGHSTRINKQIFTKVLLKISEDDEMAYYATGFLRAHFDKLPESVRNELLLKLSERELAVDNAAFSTADELVLEDIADIVAENFDKLPENIRTLLFRLLERDKLVVHVAYTVEENFDRLPEKVRNELLIKLLERLEKVGGERGAELAAGVTAIIIQNFYKLPENMISLLFKLSQRDGGAEAIGFELGENFNKLPKRIRNKLLFSAVESEDKFAGKGLAFAIEENFDKLPEKMRNELLLKLSEKVIKLSEGDEGARNSAWVAAARIASIVGKNFSKLCLKGG